MFAVIITVASAGVGFIFQCVWDLFCLQMSEVELVNKNCKMSTKEIYHSNNM